MPADVDHPPRQLPTSIAPESTARGTRILFGIQLAVHASLVWVLHASAAEPAARENLDAISVELAPPPPPPPPPPEPPPPPPPIEEPPPVRREHREPQPVAEPEPSEVPPIQEPVATDVPTGPEGEAPPPPPAPPAPVAAPAPPAPPPPPVIEAKEGANYLNNPRPAYPRMALLEGWEGRVVLKVKVLPNGRVGGAVVQKSAGRAELDKAALEVVKSWTFVPATQGGKPVAGWVSVPFEFRLQ